MLLIILGLVGGMFLLYLGAEGLVRGGAALALRLGIAPLVVGLTVVAMGTSMPELVVSVGASLDGQGALALGNVLGSNIANIALILGISALIRPMSVQSRLIRLDVPIAFVTAVLLFILLRDGFLSRPDGALLLVCFLAYTGFTIWEARRDRQALEPTAEAALPPKTKPAVSVVLVLVGLVLLVAGGSWFVDSAVMLAERLNIPDALVGLTIVAVGTSLPELATSVVASLRGQTDLSVGNVVGSNIFNILCILGLAAVIHPFGSGQIAPLDFYVMIGLTALMLPLLRTGFRLTRAEGVVLLVIYVGYITYLATSTRLPAL